MKHLLILATICLYGICTVSSSPTIPSTTRDLIQLLRNSNGNFEELRSRKNTTSGSERIAGGEPCTLPYAVSLQYSLICPDETEVWEHLCGGTMLTCSKVLTAGHCIYSIHSLLAYNQNPDIKPCEVKVRAVYGTSKLELGPVPKGVEAQLVTADMMCLPIGFSYTALTSDAGFIHLPELFKGCEKRKLPCIPECRSGSQPCPGTEATANGWGSTSASSGDLSQGLQCVNMYTMCLRECQLIFLGGGAQLGPWVTCAEGKNEDQGACPGDSGGGLIVKDRRGSCPSSTRIIAVVSSGSYQGCDKGKPNGFANLCEPELNAWLRCNMEKDIKDIPTYPTVLDASKRNGNQDYSVDTWTGESFGRSEHDWSGGKCKDKCESACMCQAFQFSI